MNWVYNDKEFTTDDIGDAVAFVYRITNLDTDKKYIGKKWLFSSRIKVIKGKRKRIKKESDWKTYYGSNEELVKDVQTLGEDHFKREILYLCKSKAMATYLELREQIDHRVLEKDGFYNAWICARVRKSNIKQ